MRLNAPLFASLCALCGCALDGENTSTTEQGLSSFSSTVNGLIPIAFWRLGDINSNLYDFGPTANDGEYHDVSLEEGGAIGGDPNTAVRFPGKDPGYGEVPDSEIQSLTRAWDDFPNCITVGCPTAGWWYSGRYAGQIYGKQWVTEAGYDQDPFSDGNFYLDSGFGVMDPLRGRDPHLVMQQGQPTVWLRDGDMQVRAEWTARAVDGPLEPVALVARRVDEKNFVRAELQLDIVGDLHLRLIRTEEGVDYILADRLVGPWNGEWWYVRFQFEGVMLRARAWAKDTPQPTTWLANAEYASPQSGTVSIRASNLNSSTTPAFHFTNFWVQTLGLTVHLFVNIEPDQQGLDPDRPYLLLFGKGDRSSAFLSVDGNQEYHFRFTPDKDDPSKGALRAYVFNIEGRLGAGQVIENIRVDQWYELVMELDSGDALDRDAGITMYVNGNLDKDGDDQPVAPDRVRVPHSGSWYNGAKHCDADGQLPLDAPAPGLPGRCEDIDGDRNLECLSWVSGTIENCWTIYPRNGDAPLRFGTADKNSWFAGRLDEGIIFSRKLKDYEVLSLFQAAQ